MGGDIWIERNYKNGTRFVFIASNKKTGRGKHRNTIKSIRFNFFLLLFHLLCHRKDKGVPGKTG